jgi:hypothetical protein
MTRTISLIAAVAGVALLVAVPAWGKGVAPEADPATKAQVLRGQALDRHYGIGQYAVDPATKAQVLRGQALDRHYGIGQYAVDPATKAQVLRGQALDRHYGIGQYSVDPATKAQVLRGQALDRHYGLGEYSSSVSVTTSRDIEWPLVGLGIGVLLTIGLYLAMKATRHRPLAH